MARQITPSLRELATRMYDLYVLDSSRYVKGTRSYGYFLPKNEPLTISVIEDHLAQRYSVSVFARNAFTKFMSFDVDTGDKAKDDVKTIIDTLVSHGFPSEYIYVSFSGGKGYHIEVFFSSPLPTTLLKRVHEFVCLTNGLDIQNIEFRPTKAQSIKLPLSVHPLTEKVCWYVDKETLAPIEDLTYVLKIGKVDADYAKGIIFSRFPKVVNRKPSSYFSPDGSDGEPQASSDPLPALLAPHTRHNTMVGIAINAREKGMPREKIEKLLLGWAEAQDKAFIGGTEREVRKDAERIASWVWGSSFKAKPTRKKTVTVTHEEFAMAVSVKNFSARLLAFLILISTKLWGQGTFSLVRLAKITGLAESTIERTLSYLCAEGVIKKKKGGMVFDIASGQMIREPSSYMFVTPPSSRRINDEGDDIGREADDITPDDEITLDISRITSWGEVDKKVYWDLYFRIIAENVREERVYAQFRGEEKDKLGDYYEMLAMGERKYNGMLEEERSRRVYYVGPEQDE